jgi:hypothetical protein
MLEGEGREVVDVTRVRDRMVAATKSYQADQKRRFDRHRSKARQYSQNDLVLIRVTCSPATGTSRNLCAKWRGPFRVTAVLDHDRYAVQDIPGATRSRVSYSGTCGAENMRPWIHVEEPTDTKGKHSEGAVQLGDGDIEVALAEWFWEDRALGGCTAVVADEDPKD